MVIVGLTVKEKIITKYVCIWLYTYIFYKKIETKCIKTDKCKDQNSLQKAYRISYATSFENFAETNLFFYFMCKCPQVSSSIHCSSFPLTRSSATFLTSNWNTSFIWQLFHCLYVARSYAWSLKVEMNGIRTHNSIKIHISKYDQLNIFNSFTMKKPAGWENKMSVQACYEFANIIFRYIVLKPMQ
jgi:hypothetical protein